MEGWREERRRKGGMRERWIERKLNKVEAWGEREYRNRAEEEVDELQ